MRWYEGIFGVVLRLCVLVVCVGLVGCRLSETAGPVDELRLLENQVTGDRHQVTGDRGQETGPLEARQAVFARETLADFPLESVLYVDVGESGDRRQVTGDRDQVTDKLSGYLNQAFAGFQGMGEGKERLGSGSGSSAGFSVSSVLNPVSSEVSSGLDQAWSQAMGVVPEGMAADLPYQDQRFVSAFYGAMQGLAGQKVGQAKGAVQQALLRSTGLSEDSGTGGLDPEMFAHLSEEGKLALTQAMVNAALDAGSESLSSFMAQLETSFTASADGDPVYSLLGIVPVWESSDLAHTTFVQSTILSQDQRTTLNIGGAYRYLSENQQHLYGINAFYDQEFRYDHRRMSFGADYQNSLLGFQANRYIALSDWRSGAKTGFEERALSGYDAQISGKLPWVAGLEAFYKRLIWQRKTGDDIHGEQIGLEYTPVPAITLRAGHEQDDERGSGFMAGVQLNTTLGGQEGVDPLAWTDNEDFLNVAQQRYQKVQRENTIRTEEREKTNASAVSARTQQVTAVLGAPTFGPMGMSPATPLNLGTIIPNDSDIFSDAGQGLTVTFSDGAVMMVGADVRVRIQDTRITYLAGTGSVQYVSGTGTPHILSVPGGEVQLLGTDISVVPQSTLASTIKVHDGRIVGTARNASNALVPSATETGMPGDVVLLETLSATTGEASKLPPTDSIVTQHQTQLFEDRTRDPQQINSITNNPKSVPFVTHSPVYAGTAVPAVGASLTLSLTFNRPVIVAGSPALRLAITAVPSGETRYATYVGGSGTNTLTFRWDPVDVAGITVIEVTQIDQTSGSITGADGGQTAESFVPATPFTMPTYSIAVSPSVIDYSTINTVTLNVTNHGAGNSAVVSLNGIALPAVPTAASLPLNVTSLPDGPITVGYYEIAGTQTLLSVSANATKNTADTTAPTITLNPVTSPSANPAQTFTGTVSDNIGTPTVQVRLSPGNITQAATVTGTSWTASVSGLTDDTYTVTARATDGVGNTTDTSPQALVINTAAPSATLSTLAGTAYSGTTILTNDATPTMTGTATGGGSATVASVHISLDNGTTWETATGTASWTYTPATTLPDTLYNVQVRVTNSLTTQATTPFTNALQVDATAPSGYTVAITPTAVNSGNQTAFAFDLAGAEVGATYSYTLSSSGGGTPVSGTGTVATTAQSFTGLDVSGLGNGTLTLSLTLRDAATNTGTAATDTVTKDTTGLTISSLTATPSTLTNTGPLTFIAQFSGAIDPASFTNSDVDVTNGTLSSRTTSDNISWTLSVTPSAGVTGTVGVAITNGAVSTSTGNALSGGPYSATRPFDNVAPTGTVTPITTNDTTPTITGTITEAGAAPIASITVNSQTYTATVSGTAPDYTWSADVTNALSNGTHNVTLNITDAAGNTGSSSSTVTINTTAPAVTLSSPTLPSGTNTATPTFTGTVTTGGSATLSQLQISLNNGTTWQTVTNITGTSWTYTPAALPEGLYTIALRATDNLGNTTGTLSQGTLTIDTTAPTILSMAAPANGTYALGQSLTFTITFGEAITVTGTPRLALTVDGNSTGYATYSGSSGGGTVLQFTYDVRLNDNDNNGIAFAAAAIDANGGSLTDAVGNLGVLTYASAPSLTQVNIDTVNPSLPTLNLQAASDSGDSNSDNITKNTTVTLDGYGDVGDNIRLYASADCSGSVIAGPVVVGAGNTFLLTGVALPADGNHTFSARATDAGNNTTCSTTPLSITRDTAAPTVSMAITSPTAGTYTTGQLITATATFSESVTGTATLPFRINGVATAAQTCTGTGTTRTCPYTLTSTDSGPITLAANALSGTLTDTAGNTATLTHGAVTTPSIMADTAAFTVTSVAIASGGSGSYLTSTAPTLRYTFSEAVNPSSISASDFTPSSGIVTSVTPVGTTPATQYNVALSGLSQGPLTLTLAAGSITSQSASKPIAANSNTAYTVDSIAPALAATPIALSGNGTCGTVCSVGNTITAAVSFTESVTGTPALNLQVGTNARAMTCSSTAGTTRTCTYTLTASDDGSIRILANQLSGTLNDTAGTAVASLNHTAVTTPALSIDTTAPSAPTAPDLIAADDTGSSSTDNITSKTNVTLNGTAEAGSTVALYDNGTCTGTALGTTTAASGNYSFSVPLPADGAYTFTAKATDSGGNASPCSTALTLTRDTAAPTVALAITSPAAGTYTTSQVITATATFSESVTGTATLPFRVNGVATAAQTCTGTGTTRTCPYTLTSTDSGPITLAANTLTGTLNDTAGNTATLTHDAVTTPSIMADTAGPTITTLTAPANGTYGSGQTLDFVATMSKATTVTGTPRLALSIGATTRYATYLSGTGTTSLTFRYTTQAGDNDTDGITVTSPLELNGGTLADSTGNAATLTFTPPTTTGVLVDTTAPTGTVTTLSTSDTTPALSGTITEASTPTATVTVNSQGPYPVTIAGTAPNYTWTLADNTITPALTAGTYDITLTITDAAGNGGNDTTTNELTVTAGGPTGCPNIGNVCSDGSIYAGVSPDGNKAMYTTTAANENSGITWNDGSGNWLDTALENCPSSTSTTVSSCWAGQSNTTVLATADSATTEGIQPHLAAQYCENLTAHGQTDWYLPAIQELNVLYTNRTAIGGFTSGLGYWSSSEVSSTHAMRQNLNNGNQGNNFKQSTFRVRCIRKVN